MDYVDGEKIQAKEIVMYKNVPSIQFTTDEVLEMEQAHPFALIGKFSGGWPSRENITRAFGELELAGPYSIRFLRPGFLFLEFKLEEDMARIWSKGRWFICGHLLRILKWTPFFDYAKESSIVPVWVRFPDLPIPMFERNRLFSIANIIGKPLKMDELTSKSERLTMARVCIEVDLLKSLPDKVYLIFGNTPVEQRVVYENMPKYCLDCHHVGHDVVDCYAFGKNPKPERKKPVSGDLCDVLNQKRRKENQDTSNNTADGLEGNNGNVWRAVGRNRSGSNQKEASSTHTRPNILGGNNANRFDSLEEEDGLISGKDQEVGNVYVSESGQVQAPENGSGKYKGTGNHHEALLTPTNQLRQEQSNDNRFDTLFVDEEYVTDAEQDVDKHGGEALEPLVTASAHKEPLNRPITQHDTTVDGEIVPPISLQPLCTLNKAQSSLGSRQSQFSSQMGQEVDGSHQDEDNTLQDIELALITISKTIDEPLEAKGEEDNLETGNSEDKELEEAPKQTLQRSLSAGNLKQKGPVILHRMATRSHTRSQGTSSSQSFQ
ncbi:hypothetical protein F511_14992 [Dorcoceras hygrometricum]|uniref:DUF4283 domain-containing protein n=1 Tax=Dorcoceras hygrometricum TaxID=472368 RepID=A0A2Z7BGJ2_9LAMI|nr:hypothetical protein F511_14992 [Dorcoceras hygrometricum]